MAAVTATGAPNPAFAHPLLDLIVDGFACTQPASRTLWLTEAFADFLAASVGAGFAPVVLAERGSRATFACKQALASVGGAWIEHSAEGFWSPVDGRAHASVTEALHAVPVQGDVSRPARPASGIPQLVFSATVHHRAAETTSVGRLAETFARELAGAPLAAWGVHEPTLLAWDPAAITAYARQQMPGPVRTLATSANGTAQCVTSIARTKRGVSEAVMGSALLADAATDIDLHAAAVNALEVIATEFEMPRIGVIAHLPDGVDEFTRPDDQGEPLALLIGPRAVHDLGTAIDALEATFDVRRVGRKRLPSVVLELRRRTHANEPSSSDGWAAGFDVARLLGDEALARALGIDLEAGPFAAGADVARIEPPVPARADAAGLGSRAWQ